MDHAHCAEWNTRPLPRCIAEIFVPYIQCAITAGALSLLARDTDQRITLRAHLSRPPHLPRP